MSSLHTLFFYLSTLPGEEEAAVMADAVVSTVDSIAEEDKATALAPGCMMPMSGVCAALGTMCLTMDTG
jgi:hypothetical protein